MAKIDKSKDNMVSAQEVGILAVKADEKGTKLINPGKATLRSKAAFVNLGVEKAFTPTFRLLAIAPIFWVLGMTP